MDIFQVGSAKASSGQRAWGHLEMGPTPDGTQIRARVCVIRGTKPGPVLYVGGAAHGEEVNGIEITRRVLNQIDPQTLSGTVIGVPIQNVPAFNHLRYTTPWDDGDLAKSYPGRLSGSLTDVMAYHLYSEAIVKANYLLDLHTAMMWGRDAACSIIPPAPAPVQQVTGELAKLFPVELMLKIPQEAAEAHFGPHFRNSVYYLLGEQGVPALLLELGEGGHLEEPFVQVGVEGVMNVLHYLEMIPGKPTAIKEAALFNDTMNARSPTSGLLWLKTELGAKVEKGAVVGVVVNIDTNTETKVLSPVSGMVSRVMTKATVIPGDRVATIAHK